VVTRSNLEKLLNRLPELSIAVLGDFFLDRYFVIESELAERSVETGLTAHQVVGRRLTPGAAGTVVSNLKALGVGEVICIGAIGMDGEGYELKNALRRVGAAYHNWLLESKDIVTPCYTKPMLRENGKERELERIDIKNRTPLPVGIEDELINRLEAVLPNVNGVVIADQVQERNCGVVTDRVRGRLGELAQQYPQKVFLADSRLRIGEFRNVITKPNMFEAVNAIRGDARTDAVGGIKEFTLEEAQDCGKKLSLLTQRDVYMTAQEQGIYIFGENQIHVPAMRVEGEIDPVGAGDSCTAGIVSALCAGASPEEAAFLGNIVASITVKKIGETGTASPEEVLTRFEEIR
jgi:rfaE bifunctional protein kinase chain/domain